MEYLFDDGQLPWQHRYRATIEFATRMGSLFRQQVRAPEKEKLIFGEPHANSMDAVLETNSVGGSRYLSKLPNCHHPPQALHF